MIYAPLIAWLLWRHRWQPELVVLGLAMWLALEYAMHRFLFHLPLRGEVARGVRFLVHEHHHAFPDDPGRLVATPWQSALALALRHHLKHHTPSGATTRFAISLPPVDVLLGTGAHVR